MNKEIELQPNTVLNLHRHNAAHVILFLTGCVEESDIDGRNNYRAGDILFRPPYSLHANCASGKTSTYIRCPISWVRFQHLHSKFGWRSVRGKIPQAIIDPVELLKNPHAGDLLADYLTEAVGDTLCGQNDLDELETLAAELRASPQSSLNLGQYARRVGVKPFELTRRFKQRFGITPSNFRSEIKIKNALSLLVERSQSLNMVALECGYADQSHFSREISKATSLTPAALRRKVSEGPYCKFVQY